MTAQENALEKIRAALELARGTTNLHEAEVAMTKAQELAFKYQIDIETIETGKTQAAVKFVDKRWGLGVKFGVPMNWRRTLMHELCNANLCRCAYIPSTPDVHVFGTQGSLEIVQFMYEALTREVERLARQEWQVYVNDGHPGAPERPGREVQWKDSFFKGAVNALTKRLRSERLRWLNEVEPQSKALIVNRDAEIERFYKNAVSTRKGEQSGASDSTGWYAGKKAGDGIALDIPLPSGHSSGGLLHG